MSSGGIGGQTWRTDIQKSDEIQAAGAAQQAADLPTAGEVAAQVVRDAGKMAASAQSGELAQMARVLEAAQKAFGGVAKEDVEDTKRSMLGPMAGYAPEDPALAVAALESMSDKELAAALGGYMKGVTANGDEMAKLLRMVSDRGSPELKGRVVAQVAEQLRSVTHREKLPAEVQEELGKIERAAADLLAGPEARERAEAGQKEAKEAFGHGYAPKNGEQGVEVLRQMSGSEVAATIDNFFKGVYINADDLSKVLRAVVRYGDAGTKATVAQMMEAKLSKLRQIPNLTEDQKAEIAKIEKAQGELIASSARGAAR